MVRYRPNSAVVNSATSKPVLTRQVVCLSVCPHSTVTLRYRDHNYYYESSRGGAGPPSVIRPPCDIGSKGVTSTLMQSDTSATIIYAVHPPPTDDGAGAHPGVQPDTVSARLLQRCVARCSSQQHPETAAHPEHSGTNRSAGTAAVTFSTTAGRAALVTIR